MNVASPHDVLAIAALLLAVASTPPASESEPGSQYQHVVACTYDLCTTSFDPARNHADFAWLWGDMTTPVRVTGDELRTLKHSNTTPASDYIQVSVHRKPAESGERSRLEVIYGPERMWGEVPEPLLPRAVLPRDGSVKVPAPGSGRLRLRVVGEHEGSWWTDRLKQAAVIPVIESVSSTIQVIDENRKPLAAAVSVMAAPAGQSEVRVLAQFRAGHDGTVHLQSLPDGETLTLIVSAPEHAPVAVSGRIGQIPRVIQLPAGVNVTGRFVDQEKHPIQDAAVTAEGWLPDSNAVVSRRTKSDAAGRWELRQLPLQQKLVLAAKRRGFVPFRRELTLPATSVDLGAVVLKKGSDLFVRAVDDSDEKPVQGAEIDASFGRKTRTNEKGLGLLKDIDDDAVLDLTSAASGYLPRKVTLWPPHKAETPLRLTRALVVRGRFVTKTGAPIDGATVRIVDGPSFRSEPVNGDFELLLAPDRATGLEFRSPSTVILRRDVEGARGEVRDLGTITPPEGGALRGRVVSDEGPPVAGAAVWAPRPSAAGTVAAWATGDVVRTQTDIDGSFTLSGGGSDRLLLRIDAAGFARSFRDATSDDSPAGVDIGSITLSRGATVRVTATKAPGIARVSLRDDTGDVDTLVAPIADAMATFEHVAPGHVLVTIRRDRATTCERDVEVSDDGKVVEVDCTVGLVHVHGRVMIGARPADGGMLVWSSAAGTPRIAGIILNQTSALGAVRQEVHGALSDLPLTVADNGVFDSDDLRAGQWSVRWFAPDHGTTAPLAILLPERGEENLVVTFPDAEIRGTVTDEAASPAKRAPVREIGGNGFALTADDGSFVMPGLNPGVHRLQSRVASKSSDTVEVTLESGRAHDPVRLVLREGDSDRLTVDVTSLEGTPASNAFVFVDTGQGGASILTTDIAGHAVLSFTSTPPTRLRCAVDYGGVWAFVDWTALDAWKKGLLLRLGETGAVTISTHKPIAPIAISGPNGWNVSLLLQQIGSRPIATAQAPLTLSGLPAGNYMVFIDGAQQSVTIRARETSAASDGQ